MIFILKVTTNKEEQALDLIANRVKTKGLNVYSIVRPHGLRGYILLEAEDRKDAEEAFKNLPYVKNLLKKPVDFSEIKHMLEPTIEEIKIEKGDIVEIIAEPLKREKARVVRINKAKEEVIIELLEAAVPIPITRKIDDVRVIRRSKEEAKKEDKTA
ncbi:transcription elongation factor Spt5 [Candidatus Pacearchaeota archaeon ex4484_26]|nr:MAG: transcription elongation factor Spt5 [Candidatus Pacearchaeota archaeon ex4484_26]